MDMIRFPNGKKDVEEKILSHYGISKKEEILQIRSKMCIFCDVPNSPESALCSSCGRSLELEAAMKIDDQKIISNYVTKNDLQSVEKNINNISENYTKLEQMVTDLRKYLMSNSIHLESISL